MAEKDIYPQLERRANTTLQEDCRPRHFGNILQQSEYPVLSKWDV